MAGWELKEGVLDQRSMDQDEFWSILKRVVSSQTKNTTTYKFCFFKSILDNIFQYNDDYIFTLDQIFNTSAEIYWNLVYKYNLQQFRPNNARKESKIESIIRQVAEDNIIEAETPYEYLNETIQRRYTKQVYGELVKYVVGAFYEDTNGRFYSFSKKDRRLQLHPDVMKYLMIHKYLVEKLNYYEWLSFLEKVNPAENAFQIGMKLDTANKRSSLKKYHDFLYDTLQQHKCFYCGKPLVEHKIHVDHVIPWCYVKSDQLWNFVLACNKCNLAKNDKLPKQVYIDRLVYRNQKIQKLNQDILVSIEFENYNNDKLYTIFKSAISNGLLTNWGA